MNDFSRIVFVILLPALLFGQNLLRIRQPNDKLDLSIQQECDIAVARGITWIQSQTNSTADAQALSRALTAILHGDLPPGSIKEPRQTIAQTLINTQRRDAVTGGGYWCQGTNDIPSIETTVQNLTILISL